jgi:hypothetical protein
MSGSSSTTRAWRRGDSCTVDMKKYAACFQPTTLNGRFWPITPPRHQKVRHTDDCIKRVANPHFRPAGRSRRRSIRLRNTSCRVRVV